MLLGFDFRRRFRTVQGFFGSGKYLPETDEDKEVYKYAMHTILRSLIENYANHSHKPGEALLLHGVYSWHSGKGIDVGNIWGDYYYVEALVRFLKDWKVWW